MHSDAVDESVGFEAYSAISGVGSGTEHTMFADRQGSVIWVTEPATGQVVAGYEYDGYGQITQTTGTLIQPYGYTGREYDAESGLYHYRARAYDPAAGVFVQVDPIEFEGGQFNLASYVGNSPLNAIDPSGQAVSVDMIGAGGAAGLGAIALFAPNEDGVSLAGAIFSAAMNIVDVLERLRVEDALAISAPAPGGKDPFKGNREVLKEHQEKLRRYLNDPFSGDNLGKLTANMHNPLAFMSIFLGTVKHYRDEIMAAAKNIRECEAKNGL